MTTDSSGTWIIRYRSDSGPQLRHTLGALDLYPAFERFDKTVNAAQKWLSHINSGGSTESSTVLDACNAYTRKDRELRGDKSPAGQAKSPTFGRVKIPHLLT